MITDALGQEVTKGPALHLYVMDSSVRVTRVNVVEITDKGTVKHTSGEREKKYNYDLGCYEETGKELIRSSQSRRGTASRIIMLTGELINE